MASAWYMAPPFILELGSLPRLCVYASPVQCWRISDGNMVRRKLSCIFAAVLFCSAVLLSIAAAKVLWPIYRSAKEAQYKMQCLQQMKTASGVIEEFATNHGDRLPTAAELDEITAKSTEPNRSMKWGIGFNSKSMGRKLDDVSPDVPLLFSVERKSERLIVGATLADARPAWGSWYLMYSFNRGVHVNSSAELKALDAPSASERNTR